MNEVTHGPSQRIHAHDPNQSARLAPNREDVPEEFDEPLLGHTPQTHLGQLGTEQVPLGLQPLGYALQLVRGGELGRLLEKLDGGLGVHHIPNCQ